MPSLSRCCCMLGKEVGCRIQDFRNSGHWHNGTLAPTRLRASVDLEQAPKLLHEAPSNSEWSSGVAMALMDSGRGVVDLKRADREQVLIERPNID